MIGDNIQRLRRIRNMTQKELAEKAGVSLSRVSLWEQNKHYPLIKNIRKIAAVLGVTPRALVKEDNKWEDRNCRIRYTPFGAEKPGVCT